MPVALEHAHLGLRFALGAELHLEELPPFVGDNIERVVGAPAIARHVIWTNDPEPRAHTDELIRDRFRVHNLKLGRARRRDRLRFDLEPLRLSLNGWSNEMSLDLMV